VPNDKRGTLPPKIDISTEKERSLPKAGGRGKTDPEKNFARALPILSQKFHRGKGERTGRRRFTKKVPAVREA